MKNNNNNPKFRTYLKDNEIQEMVKTGFVRYVGRLTDTSLVVILSTTGFNKKKSKCSPRCAVLRFFTNKQRLFPYELLSNWIYNRNG
jgi:hypothetical protein